MLLTIVPLVVAQAVTLFAVMRTVEKDVDTRARESLVVGGGVVTEYLDSRRALLRTSVEVLSADFGFKQAVATEDADTIRSVLNNHRRRIGADVAIFVDLDGTTIASTTESISNLPAELLRLTESTAVFDGTAYHVIVVPLKAPVTIGWAALAFRIDERLANKFASLTGLDISIVSSVDHSATVLASTNPAFQPGGPASALYSSDTLLTMRQQYIKGPSDVVVVLQRSLDDAMLPYAEARQGLFLFSVVLVILVAIAGVLFSTTIARPLRTLAEAAHRMIAGNYEGGIAVTSGDEFGALASSFNSMRLAISEREQKISHQALHNDLTGLPNRSKVLQQLTNAIEIARSEQKPVAILSICLSRMGEISSTLGHKATDELMIQAARHLNANLDHEDTLGHTGTNEFVLILPGRDSYSARPSVEKIELMLASGVKLNNTEISLQTEVGIAEFPKHGDAAAELMRFASIALTEAGVHKERVRVYESGREEEFVKRLRVVNDLRGALRHREVQVWYQPKTCLKEGDVCGVEALVRWEHPEFGFLSPDDFIPAAEQAGTIIHLTRYALNEAIIQCRTWQNAGFNLQMSVNISVRDLTDEYLPYYIMQLLKDNDVTAESLTLEVTESSIMSDLGSALLILECLRDIGVRISIDDFGTGHSSLAQLRNLPVDELKIDKSFIFGICDDPQNEAIVRSTIDLAHSLNLEVVAEGVEDVATMRRISELGCEYAQGYFLSRPIPAEELTEWLHVFTPTVYHERHKSGRAFAAKG